MNIKRMLAAAAAILISLLLTVEAYAAETPGLQDTCAAALVKLDIMHKDSKGNLKLKDKTKRSDFIAMVNSAMSYDPADSKDVKISYKDITAKHKAYNDIKTAAAHGLIEAYEDNTIRPDKSISYAEAMEILLKALGYGKTIKGADSGTVLEKAAGLGLGNGVELKPDAAVSRGDASIIIFNSLTVPYSNQ